MKIHAPARQNAVVAYATTLLLMLPLFGLLAYAYAEGSPPAPQRWVDGYRWAGPVAAGELLLALTPLLTRSLRMSRLVVGVLVYVVVCSVLAWFGFYRALAYLGAELRGSGVILAILGVGIVSTWATREGFVGVLLGSPARQREASLRLLGVAAAAAVFSVLFRDSRWLGTGLPMVVLFAAQRIIVARTLRATARASMGAVRPDASGVSSASGAAAPNRLTLNAPDRQ